MNDFEFVAFLQHRYGTADLFVIANNLNIEINWNVLTGTSVLGKTKYVLDDPIIILSSAIKHSSKKYFVMTHELGHVLLYKGLEGFYKIETICDTKPEFEADKFAIWLLFLLYQEDHIKEDICYTDIANLYGLPEKYMYLFDNRC